MVHMHRPRFDIHSSVDGSWGCFSLFWLLCCWGLSYISVCLNSGSPLFGMCPHGWEGAVWSLWLICFPGFSMLPGQTQHLSALGGDWPHSCFFVHMHLGRC